MDHQDHDKVFFTNFSLVMGGLFAIFFFCIAMARWYDKHDRSTDPEAIARVAQNTEPVAQVFTDPAALLKVAAAAPARAAYTGEQVNGNLCAGCHGSGVLGAPKTGDKAAWSARLSAAGGLDGLVGHAVSGKNSMPPKGGDASLSDQEVHDAVVYLLKQAGI